MELINTVEAKFPVDRWKVNGIRVWPLMRISLTYDLFHSYHLPKPRGIKGASAYVLAAHALRLARNLARFPFAWLADRKNNARRRDGTGVAFLSDGISFVEINGARYDRFCDPLRKRFHDLNVSTFMMTLSHNYLVPRFSPSRFIQPVLDALKIRALVRSKLSRDEGKSLQGFPELAAYFASRDLKEFTPSLPHLNWQTLQIRLIANYFKGALMQSGAPLGFVVSYFGIEGMAFNLACRELGIHSVDIQHGYGGDLCTPYGRWNNVPTDGFELLPSIFWCWSENDADAIRKWNSKVARWHKPLVGGNLFARQWHSGDPELAGRFDRIITDIKTSHPDAIHILYTLNCLAASEFEKLTSIIRAVQGSPVKAHFWIRLHPCRLNKRPEVLRHLRDDGNHGFELDVPSRLPLYALLRHMDLHMTEFSSTVVEAADFGVPSVIVNEFGRELYAEQVASGWALPVSSLDEIADAVRKQFSNRVSLNRSYETSQISDRVIDDLLLGMIQKTV